MTDTRSPIDRMIDDACGFKPLTGEMTPERKARIIVKLRCPKCKAEQECARDDSDPPNCALVEITCLKCHDGSDRQLVDYFDADGRQIDCDGNAVDSSLNADGQATAKGKR